MKKDKLIQEFEGLKINNAEEVLGGACDHPTVFEDVPTTKQTNQNCNGINIIVWDSDTQDLILKDPDSVPDTIHPERPHC